MFKYLFLLREICQSKFRLACLSGGLQTQGYLDYKRDFLPCFLNRLRSFSRALELVADSVILINDCIVEPPFAGSETNTRKLLASTQSFELLH